MQNLLWLISFHQDLLKLIGMVDGGQICRILHVKNKDGKIAQIRVLGIDLFHRVKE
jgi:hypothetical protein